MKEYSNVFQQANKNSKEQLFSRYALADSMFFPIYYRRIRDSPLYFSNEEIELLSRVADNIGYALSTFKMEDQRKKIETQLLKISQAVEQSFASIVITDVAGNIEYVNPAFTKLTGYSFEEAIGQNPRILKTGYTSDYEYVEIWQDLTHTKPWQGEFCNKKKNGEIYWEYAVISPIVNLKGEITNYVAVKENITERKRLEQEEKELAEIIENTIAFVGRADLNKNILYLNKAMLNILELDEKEDITKLKISDFIVTGQMEMNNRQEEELFKYGKWVGENIFKSRSGKLIPVLQVIVFHKNKQGDITHSSTTAIDVSRFKESENELIRVNTELKNFARHLQNISEIERKEIARDIHDELGQNLTALNLHVSWLRSHLDGDKESLQKRIDNITADIKDTMDSFRRIHSSLHPAMLEDLGLESSMTWLVNSIKKSTNLSIEFYSKINSEQIAFEIALPIYRVAQESLTNIMRYAKATVVSVSIVQKDDVLALTVEDNGCGFDISKVDTKLHHGILGMRERVLAINGQFNINSAIGKGTIVTFTVPISI